jgi:hypothetical protein
VAEQKDRLARAACRAKAKFQDIAEVLLPVQFDAATDGLGEAGNEANGLIDGCLVVAGRLDEDEIAKGGFYPGGLGGYGCEECDSFVHRMYGCYRRAYFSDVEGTKRCALGVVILPHFGDRFPVVIWTIGFMEPYRFGPERSL